MQKTSVFFSALMSVLVLTGLVAASTPRLISYQGFITDGGGSPIDGTASITFSIYDADVGGAQLWTENHASVSIDSGVFTVLLGSITPLDDSVFNDSSRYLGVAIGGDPEIDPRSQLLSVPYSYRVDGLEGAEGGTVHGSVNIISGDEVGTLKITGSAGDSVIINPSAGIVLLATDDNGDVRMTIAIGADDVATVSFYDPVDVKSGDRAVGKKTVSIDNSGIVFFGTTPADTTIRIDTLGNFRGHGQMAMGANSTNGGAWATVFGYNNNVSGDSSTILGGYDNSVSGPNNTITGGVSNDIHGRFGFIANGLNNLIDTAAYFSSIGGGKNDTVLSEESVIAGGTLNYISANVGSILGGVNNRVTGSYGSVLGGLANQANGTQSVAIGTRARANHDGSIVIAASNAVMPADSVRSGTENQIVLRADSGIYITRFPEQAADNGGKLINTSTDASSRYYKENLKEVSGSDILTKLEALPLYQWNYVAEPDISKHMGPMAEDFHASFSLGGDNKTISGVDRNGVALAAIKALIVQNRNLTERIEALEKKLSEADPH